MVSNQPPSSGQGRMYFTRVRSAYSIACNSTAAKQMLLQPEIAFSYAYKNQVKMLKIGFSNLHSVATTPLLGCPVGDRLQAALRPIVKTVATNTPPGYFLTEEEGQGLAMQEREMDEWKEDREEVMEEVVRLRKMHLRYYTLHELIVQGPDHE